MELAIIANQCAAFLVYNITGSLATGRDKADVHGIAICHRFQYSHPLRSVSPSLAPIVALQAKDRFPSASFTMKFAPLVFLATMGSVMAADDNTIGFGPYFSLGPTASWIRSAKTTLVLPNVPSPAIDRLALWPGMGTSGNDLIQALAVSFSDPKANCGAVAGQWCVWASTLQDGTQLYGKQVPANAGDQITMSCKKRPGSRINRRLGPSLNIDCFRHIQ